MGANVVDLEQAREQRKHGVKAARYVAAVAEDGRVVVKAGDLEIASMEPDAADAWADGVKYLATVARLQRQEQG